MEKPENQALLLSYKEEQEDDFYWSYSGDVCNQAVLLS